MFSFDTARSPKRGNFKVLYDFYHSPQGPHRGDRMVRVHAHRGLRLCVFARVLCSYDDLPCMVTAEIIMYNCLLMGIFAASPFAGQYRKTGFPM